MAEGADRRRLLLPVPVPLLPVPVPLLPLLLLLPVPVPLGHTAIGGKDAAGRKVRGHYRGKQRDRA